MFEKLVKLAGISYAFNRFSFTNKILGFVEQNHAERFRSLRERDGYREVVEHYDWVQQHKADYYRDNLFLLRSEFRSAQPSAYYRLARTLWRALPKSARYRLRNRTWSEPPPESSPLIFHADPPPRV